MTQAGDNRFTIYTDGGSRGNPGQAAIGFVIEDASGARISSHGEAIGEATNNEAEYRAVIAALKKLKALVGKKTTGKSSVAVLMDSEFVSRQLNREYKIEEERLFPLFIGVLNLMMDFGHVEFRHIAREKNREADRLVNEALDREQKKLW
jgi:ribonuclease HI